MRESGKTMQTGYDLRRATPEDEVFLCDLYASARPDAALLEAWPEAERTAFLRSQFELQQRHYETAFPDSQHDIILVEGRPAGRLWMDWRADEARCLDIALLPACRGAGLGSRLFEDLKIRACERGLPLTLSVEHGNPHAQRFYGKQGFRALRDLGSHVLMEWLPSAAG